MVAVAADTINNNKIQEYENVLRGSPSLVGLGIANPQEFYHYLLAQKKRNVRQIMCYAQRYRQVLETGDASALVSLSSGAIKCHAMEALTVYAKYSGLYEEWCQIRKRYSLHWTNGDESLQAMQRFFGQELSFDVMLSRIKEMVHELPTQMGEIVKFACIVGLRPAEVVESVKLLRDKDTYRGYYNEERQCLEHFRFPSIFLRRTKKAFISYITLDNLQPIANLGDITPPLL